MAELRAGINEAKVDALQVLPRGMCHEGLSQDKRSLLDTNNGALEHDPILADHAVVHKTTHGGDRLFGEIGLGLAGGVVPLLPDTVDLLVHLRAVEVPVLARAGHGRGDATRMPRANARNLAEAAVGLAG